MNGSSAAANKAALRRIITAYSMGNISPLLDALHPEVVWMFHGPREFLRFAGEHVGKNNCLAGLSIMGAEFALHSYDIIEMVAEDDVVWMQGRVETSRRSGGQRLILNAANRWQFADGKITHLTEYLDTASMLLGDGRLKAAG